MTWADVAQTIASALVPLLSVAPGGWLTLQGTRSTQKLQLEEEKARRHADKLEQLVLAVHEQDHWLDRVRSEVYGGEAVKEIPPGARVDAIAAIYFPEAALQVRVLDAAVADYVAWAAKATLKRAQGDIMWLLPKLGVAF
jgi:hypothetical protein